MKILLVDDENEVIISMQRLLKRKTSHEINICNNGLEAVDKIKNGNYDLVLLDLLMPESDGFKTLEMTKPHCPDTEFIILTAVDEIESAVKTIRLGAFDYLVKPAEPERILLTIERALERKTLKQSVNILTQKSEIYEINDAFKSIVTRSDELIKLFKYAEIISRSNSPILISGETGTGKELFARAIHKLTLPENSPFVAVNMASIPDSLFESLFFGYKKGSFTNAVNDYNGYFTQADKGTLFLDEIGELPLSMQAKLLRIIEEQSFTPLGDSVIRKVNVRIISATNKDIELKCRTNEFRSDLFYRLAQVKINLPPLHMRNGDIPLLTDYFVKKFSTKYGRQIISVSQDIISLLQSIRFPGNIRELSGLIENAVLINNSGHLSINDFKFLSTEIKNTSKSLPDLKENELSHIRSVMEFTGNNKKETASILGISLRQLQRKLAEIKYRNQ